MAGFEPWTRERGADIIASESAREGAGLPILHALQAAFGYIHAEAVLASQFPDRRRARGQIIMHAVTLLPVFCLGLCAIGPSAMLDGAPLGRLDSARIDAALERTR